MGGQSRGKSRQNNGGSNSNIAPGPAANTTFSFDAPDWFDRQFSSYKPNPIDYTLPKTGILYQTKPTGNSGSIQQPNWLGQKAIEFGTGVGGAWLGNQLIQQTGIDDLLSSTSLGGLSKTLGFDPFGSVDFGFGSFSPVSSILAGAPQALQGNWGKAVASTVGSALGQIAIPIPGIGGAIGAFAGNLVGDLFSSNSTKYRPTTHPTQGGQQSPFGYIGHQSQGLSGAGREIDKALADLDRAMAQGLSQDEINAVAKYLQTNEARRERGDINVATLIGDRFRSAYGALGLDPTIGDRFGKIDDPEQRAQLLLTQLYEADSYQDFLQTADKTVSGINTGALLRSGDANAVAQARNTLFDWYNALSQVQPVYGMDPSGTMNKIVAAIGQLNTFTPPPPAPPPPPPGPSPEEQQRQREEEERRQAEEEARRQREAELARQRAIATGSSDILSQIDALSRSIGGTSLSDIDALTGFESNIGSIANTVNQFYDQYGLTEYDALDRALADLQSAYQGRLGARESAINQRVSGLDQALGALAERVQGLDPRNLSDLQQIREAANEYNQNLNAWEEQWNYDATQFDPEMASLQEQIDALFGQRQQQLGEMRSAATDYLGQASTVDPWQEAELRNILNALENQRSQAALWGDQDTTGLITDALDVVQGRLQNLYNTRSGIESEIGAGETSIESADPWDEEAIRSAISALETQRSRAAQWGDEETNDLLAEALGLGESRLNTIFNTRSDLENQANDILSGYQEARDWYTPDVVEQRRDDLESLLADIDKWNATQAEDEIAGIEGIFERELARLEEEAAIKAALANNPLQGVTVTPTSSLFASIPASALWPDIAFTRNVKDRYGRDLWIPEYSLAGVMRA